MNEYGPDDERAFIQDRIKPHRSFAEMSISPTEVKLIMAKKNLSQSDLARLLGVSQVAVSRWARGKIKPSAINVMMLKEIQGGTFGFPLMNIDEVSNVLTEIGWSNHIQEVNIKRIIACYSVAYLRLVRMGMTGQVE